MSSIAELFDNVLSGTGRYPIMIIGAIIIFYIPFMIIYMKKKQKQASDFKEVNPQSAKVYIVNSSKGHMVIKSIDNQPPVLFHEGLKYGVYLVPGERTLNIEYSWTRAGVLHKTVTTFVGPVDVKFTANPKKCYEIDYDKKNEKFNIVEI